MILRSGALGFLYTGSGDLDSPGNLGILDQKMALAWVTDNIEYFGGDPNKETLEDEEPCEGGGGPSSTGLLIGWDEENSVLAWVGAGRPG